MSDPASTPSDTIRLSAFADEIAPDPVDQVAVLTRHGIRYIEFRSIFGTNVLDLSTTQHEAFRTLLQREGMGLSAIGSPIGKIPITEAFEPHLERLAHAIELAHFYQTPNIRIFSFYMPPGEDPEAHRDEVFRRMEAMASLGEKSQVRLVLENEKGIYGDTAARVDAILQAVPNPWLGLAFDPANYLEVGQEIEPAWKLLRPRVMHFHVKDYDRSLKRNVPAGEGEGRIPELIADAVASGYRGFCVLEPHLVVAEQSYGFTGPERFADAARALQSGLQQRQVAYA